jgi:glycosyltransferase involved in cell wall biosynthesis
MKILVVSSYSRTVSKISSEISSNVEELILLTSLYKKKGSILYFLSSLFPLIDIKTISHSPQKIDQDNVIVKGEVLRIINQVISKFAILKIFYRLNELIIDRLLIREAKRIMKKNVIDILIVYDPVLLAPILKNKADKVKSVFIMTGAAPKYVFEKLIKEEKKFQNYRLYREFSFSKNYLKKYNESVTKFDLIIAPSLHALESLSFPIKNGKILNFGFELRNEVIKQIQRDDDELRVVFVGRATLLKGFHYLVELANAMINFNVKFYFIGDITDKIIKENNIPNNIEIIGRINNSEVLRILSLCDILFHPTLSEGQSIAIMEALSLGLTVITTKASGYSELFGKNNRYIYNEINIDNIRNQLLLILNDKKELYEESSNSINIARNLTWNKYGEKLTSHIQEILN